MVVLDIERTDKSYAAHYGGQRGKLEGFFARRRFFPFSKEELQ